MLLFRTAMRTKLEKAYTTFRTMPETDKARGKYRNCYVVKQTYDITYIKVNINIYMWSINSIIVTIINTCKAPYTQSLI